ncbi:MAG: HAMP domain-containing protein [Lentisphaerae bacterium]|nr:HAMP domain-containing protein [Lentisphaerota bacterium]
MLRTKLFKAFAGTVFLFAVLSGLLGARTIHRRVLDEAQKRVRMDLNGAWSQVRHKMDMVELSLSFAAAKPAVVHAAQGGKWDDPEIQRRIEQIRIAARLDFLDILSPDGEVVLRSTPPYAKGDSRLSDAAVRAALKGEASVYIGVLTRDELEREADGLAERAFLELEDTPRARKSMRSSETRGMTVVSAAPIMEGGRLLGVVYGGRLLNRNFELVDEICVMAYGGEEYKGAAMGTATVFLDDCRVATTVRQKNGNRAIGSRVSKEVADRVLDNGEPWVGEAFVVKDWYITAYDPIRNGDGAVIGMLYVGILKQPFLDHGRSFILRYLGLSMLFLLLALVIAYVVASRIAQPIHRLVEASNRMSGGMRPGPVPSQSACRETSDLIEAFNQMSTTLAEREERLLALNRNYMETLGFVSHELKSPVATIMNYAYLLNQKRLGPLTEAQEKAIRSIESGSKRLVEMVRHYLNLSRIENKEVHPVPTRFDVLSEVLQPLSDDLGADMAARQMRLTVHVPQGTFLSADANMSREVFENLLGNAVKYGRAGGEVSVSVEPEGGMMRFRIRNEGEGIPADKLDAIFQKFTRLEGSSAVRGQKGTGLGLFITKNIIEAHGGAIRAASKQGEWAEFEFTLPACPEEKK